MNSERDKPPSTLESADGWIASEQLPKILRQDLRVPEAGAFLKYLFSAIGRRPKRLSLREGAAVARYLSALAWETEPGPMRALVERLGDVIWRVVLQHAPFPASGKKEALQFLEKHGSTYLAGFNVAAALVHVRNAEPPRHRSGVSAAPRLLSTNLSVQGQGPPQLQDDLSERIYGGYVALRRAGVRNVRGLIAATLNEYGLETRARGATWRAWGPEEVYERVKQFEAREKRRTGNLSTPEQQRRRDAAADRWVYLFHTQPARDRQEGGGPA